jgi:hypothetical protein
MGKNETEISVEPNSWHFVIFFSLFHPIIPSFHFSIYLTVDKRHCQRQVGVLEELYTCLPAGRAAPFIVSLLRFQTLYKGHLR